MADNENKVEEKVEKKEEKKTVTIHLIPSEWDNAEFYVFGINGKTYQINTGEDVEVPIALAKSIKNITNAKKTARTRAKNNGKKL